jgi:hypothetical protein
MGVANPGSRPGLPTTLGLVALSCALVGLLACYGYGTFATRGIRAAHARDMAAAGRMASYAGSSSVAQLVLGLLAVWLGSIAVARSLGWKLAFRLGLSAIGLGVVDLALVFLLVV